MRYVEARITEWSREEAYRLYVTRSLQLAPQQQWLTAKFSDIFKAPVAEKSGDEIALEIMAKADLKFG